MALITILTPEQVEKYWSTLEEYIQKGIEFSNGELSAENIYHNIQHKKMVLMAVFTDSGDITACVILEFINHDTGKRIMYITLAGGDDMHEWFEEVDKVTENIARTHDCVEIAIIGRKGWERQMRPLGYKHAHTVITREVKNG